MSNPELEAAILDAPKPDLDAWQVYEKAKRPAKTALSELIAEYDAAHADELYGNELARGIEAIAKAGRLESLRSLFIGAFENPDGDEILISAVSVGDVGELLPVAPNLPDERKLAGLFTGAGVPKLEHLGLQNSDFQDDVAIALSKSALLAQLRTSCVGWAASSTSACRRRRTCGRARRTTTRPWRVTF